MKGIAGGLGISLIALASACTTGSVDDDDDSSQVGDDDPEDMVTCSAELDVSGTFTVSDPQPEEIVGCWPIGTWTYQVSITSNDCAVAPTPLASYSFRGERDLSAEDPNYAWNFIITSPDDPTASVSVQSGGGGLCSAGMMVYSTDGKSLFNLHPALQEGGELTGHGTYEVHTQDQRPEGS